MTITVDFLESHQPGGPWYLSGLGEGAPVVQRCTTPEQAESFIERYNGKLNLYFRVNNPKRTATGVTVRRTDVVEGTHVYIDIDSTYKAGESHEAVLAKLEAFEPKRSYVVFTGGGYQGHWILSEPVSGDTIERMVDALNEKLGGDASVHTPEHLMRLPGTLNIPNTKKRALGRVETMTELLVSDPHPAEPWEFDLAPPRPPQEHVSKLEMGEIPRHVEIAELPAPLQYLIMHGQDEEDSKQGDRSRYLISCAVKLLRAGVTVEAAWSILDDDAYGISRYPHDKADEMGDREGDRQIERALTKAVASMPPTAQQDFDGIEYEEQRDMFDSLAEMGKDERAEKAEKRQQRLAGLRVLEADQMDALPKPTWLIEELVEEFALGQIIGVQKHGKTHFALDLALHVAMGKDFHGHKTKRVRVLYIIAEGSPARFWDRVKAWCIEHEVSRQELQGWFGVLPRKVTIDRIDEVADFVAANFRGPQRVGLVITDTVARNMAGNESEAQDMGAFVAGEDYIRETFGCAALVLHHIGKDTSKGGRGSTALPGAVDVTITVTKGVKREIKAQVTEMRATEEGERFIYQMVEHEVDSEDMRTCVTLRLLQNLAPGEKEDKKAKPSASAEDMGLTETDLRVMQALRIRGAVNARSHLASDEPGMSEANVGKVMRHLTALGMVSNTSPFQLTPLGDKTLED